MKKKMIALLLCAMMTGSLVACADKNTEVSTESTEQAVATTQQPVATTDIEYMPMPTVEECNITLCDYNPMTIELTGEYAVAEEQVNTIINTLLQNSNVTLEHDTVEEGDYAKVDYTGYKDGVAFEGGAATNQLLDVSNNCVAGGYTGFIDGFTAGLVGQKVGDTVSYEVTFPEEYGNEELNGQTVTFEFVIHSSYKQVTVEDLTDEQVATQLAEIFKVTTKQQLIDYVTSYVASQMAYGYILDYLLEHCTVELPDSYVDYMLELYTHYLAQQNFGSYDAMIAAYEANGASWEDQEKQLRESLVEELNTQMILMAIAQQEGITATEEQLKQAAQTYLTANGGSFETEEQLFAAMGYGSVDTGRDYLNASFLNGLAVGFITENATAVGEDGTEYNLTYEVGEE